MFTRLLRRLQGHSTVAIDDAAVPPAPQAAVEHIDAPPDDATLLDPATVAVAFVRHLLDTPADVTMEPGYADEIADRLEGLSSRLDVARLPRLPALVPQLLAAMRRDDIDTQGLANVVGRDPTLAGEVVRVSNSAHYRRGGPISSLPQAIGVLGDVGLRYVVLRSVMRPILCADPSQQGARSGERLAAQAEARTWLCGALAPGSCDPGEAQLASVLASTGLSALLRMMPRVLLVKAAADDTFAPRFLQLAGALSARAAEHWHLSDGLRTSLSSMHDVEPQAPPLQRVLGMADRMAMLHVLRAAGTVEADACIPDAATPQAASLLQTLAALDADV